MIDNFSKIELHEFIESLVKGLESKDLYTSGHSERVAHLAERIALEMNLSKERVFNIHIAGHLHDIGKIGVPDSILKKNGRLTEKEYEEIKKHSVIGYEIINKIKSFKEIAIYIKHHHEHYDGKGYPDNIKAKDIPLESRIISIADSFDAMTSPRHYRTPVKIVEAIKEIKLNSGTQFDPQLVQAINNIYQHDYSFLERIVHSAFQSEYKLA
ncbi:HD-GYP domain-containing protein [Orenia marismortui]|uniref:HD domain-containing protein n=1 Tax=Orenia marismortui TaxID=46469 RepID=A0A4V3GYI6_9FIRM|nr:HD-GYP domain-containing protein [Orenia marismortui]TDX52891.1 HD domain-containing protein [Orenia marismortui]